MAKLKIYTFPDKVLSQVAQPVDKVLPRHVQLSKDMLETMYEAPGIGLAANQVGVLERIIVVDVDFSFENLSEGEQAPEGAEIVEDGYVTDKNPRVFINPRIIQSDGETVFCEGCLSVPEFTADVKRAEEITLKYLDIKGDEQELKAEGLLAICIQHEMDHLAGKLFIDRLSPLKREMAKKKLGRLEKDNNVAKKLERELMGKIFEMVKKRFGLSNIDYEKNLVIIF